MVGKIFGFFFVEMKEKGECKKKTESDGKKRRSVLLVQKEFQTKAHLRKANRRNVPGRKAPRQKAHRKNGKSSPRLTMQLVHAEKRTAHSNGHTIAQHEILTTAPQVNVED